MSRPLLSALVASLLANAAFADDQTMIATAPGGELLLSGPIEKLDAALDTVTVFGHDVSTVSASNLAVGQIVNVYGLLKDDGSIVNPEIEPTTIFGSGSDPVFMKGMVTDVNAALGQAQFGDITVDYTGQLSASEFSSPLVGEVLGVMGTQPLVKGVVLASAIGADVVAKASVQARGFSVVATRGGTRASQGIQGGGASKAGIQGGGAATAGIQGGGASKAGIQGGGAATAGIQGGGAAKAGIQGGGAATAGIQGGGASKAGIQGGGAGSI